MDASANSASWRYDRIREAKAPDLLQAAELMYEEHLKILRQGVGVWNAWRKEHPDVRPNLEGADLQGTALHNADLNNANLKKVNLSRARLQGAYLQGAHLQSANLRDANCRIADLRDADLRDADLREVDFRDADLQATNLKGADLQATNLKGVDLQATNLQATRLQGADLRKAGLQRADLRGAGLGDADLREADLCSADLQGAVLWCTDFQGARLGDTGLGSLDLSGANGLEKIEHTGPSTVGTNTLAISRGRIPAAFLRGCGLTDWEIEAAKLYNPDLTEAERIDITYQIVRIQGESPIQINPLFISYSHADSAFVEALEGQLNDKRIRFWRDAHHMTSGRIEKQIDRAMRLNPTVLLVLSEHSVESDWVEWEVFKARELEKELGQDVLCPVALDEAWKTCRWEGPLRRQVEKYFILDFSAWEEPRTFAVQFGRLVEGLGIFYPGKAPAHPD